MKASISALLAALATLTITACAADSPANAGQTLVGEIHIKGNEPFPTVMLETGDKTFWELSGVPVAEAHALTGKRVTAHGTIERPPGPNTWLPSLRVDSIPEPVNP